MAKKSETKKLTMKLDNTWADAVKSVGWCEYCHTTSSLQAHHIFGRRNYSTRWDLNNGVCLCAKHHTLSTEFSAHQTPLLFAEWIINQNGQGWYEELKRKANGVSKLTINDKKEILSELLEL